MKVATRQGSTLIQGEVESVQMGISQKGMVKMGRFLRDQIYTHKAWAVVREIIANAVDEHGKHNINRPVLVTLPTINDPHFRVRDFANGLSKDMVFRVFFQYFESTKSDSNDDIGGFGIGAKSPLAYAEMFFVESYHSGSKTSYVANINGEASTAHKMSLEDSNETGIEVVVPVKQNDFAHFAKLVGELIHFSGWNIEIADGIEVEKPKSEWVIENKYGKVGHARSMFKSPSEIYANVKGIMYVVDSNDQIKSPFFNQVVLNFTGDDEIEIHPSRERVELTTRNIFKIKTALENLEKEVVQTIAAQFANAKTARDRFAINASSGAFRSKQPFVNAGLINVLPQHFQITMSECVFISWNSSEIERKPLRSMFRYPSSTVAFTPMGQADKDSYYKKDSFVQYGSIIIMPNEAIRSEYVIAYAEKMGISSPVFCTKDDTVPANWIEGSDYWRFDESQVSKEEAKAIRDIYSPRTPRGKTVSIKGNEIMGYRSTIRHHRCEVTMDHARQITNGILLIPMDMLNYQKDKLHKIVKTVSGKTPVFVFSSRFPLWKKSGLQYEIYDAAKFEVECANYLAQDFTPQTSNGLEENWHSVSNNPSKYSTPNTIECGVKSSVMALFPSIKIPATNQTLEANWKAAQARWDALTPLQRDLASISQWSSRWSAASAEGKAILKSVFA